MDLAAHARERGIDVHMLEKDTDLFDLARRAVRSGADCLGAAGGDGTLAIVAEVAIEAGLPFVCIPAGTRNHFALDLGLDREDPLGALDAFGEAVERRIDVGDVSGKMFLNNVSIGAYGEIVGEEEYRDNKVGTALLKLPDLIGPDAEPLDLRFVDGSGKQYDTAVVVHVSNNSYVLTPRPGFGSRPSLSDGELGIVVVVPGARGAAVKVLHWEAPSFTVESAIAIASGLDGESIALDPPAEFSIRRGALQVRTPLGAPGVSPGAKLATAERPDVPASDVAGRRPHPRQLSTLARLSCNPVAGATGLQDSSPELTFQDSGSVPLESPPPCYSAGSTSEWRNWQTRQLEGLVSFGTWGFKSPLRHRTDVRPALFESLNAQVIDVCLSRRRDMADARRFFDRVPVALR